jgi:DUF1365 family protein
VAALVPTRIFHVRSRPRHNAFRYTVLYVALTLEDIERRKGNLFFSFERFNLLSFYARDHADGTANPRAWIEGLLLERGIAEADGEVLLVTLPRILGYVFNPVSFWLCHDREGRPRAVVAEVNNTFGERHCYLCVHPDRRPILPGDELSAEKAFHVSPFLKVEGRYTFRFAHEAGALNIHIALHNEEGLALSTGMSGPLKPMSSSRVLLHFLRSPFGALKVMALIHYQAVKLLLKGVRHLPKPPPPTTEVTQ